MELPANVWNVRFNSAFLAEAVCRGKGNLTREIIPFATFTAIIHQAFPRNSNQWFIFNRPGGTAPKIRMLLRYHPNLSQGSRAFESTAQLISPPIATATSCKIELNESNCLRAMRVLHAPTTSMTQRESPILPFTHSPIRPRCRLAEAD